MEVIGVHHFWGFTPALDLLAVYNQVNATHEAPDSALVVVLIDVGDIRHVLKTIAQRWRHGMRKLQFHIFGRPMESLARDLLLLAVAFDWSVPLRQRAHAWLELFGNTLLPERTSKYLAKQRLSLIKLVCGDTDAGILRRVVDLSALKYKHRDALHAVFATWAHSVQADMPLLHEHRLRHQYGARYDFRSNLMDWDYQFRVKPSTGIIHPKQFKAWRETGVAFEFGDAVYRCANRSLLSYAEGKEGGRSRQRRGFWGDVAVSPFHALGTSAFTGLGSGVKGAAKAQLPSDLAPYTPPSAVRYAPGVPRDKAQQRAAELFDVHSRHSGSEQWRHHAVEVAVFNLLSQLHEMEQHSMYTLALPHGIYSGLGETHHADSTSAQAAVASGAAAGDDAPAAPAAASGAGAAAAAKRARCIAASLGGVTVLPRDGSDMRAVLQHISDRPAHVLHGGADVCVVGSKAAHLLAPAAAAAAGGGEAAAASGAHADGTVHSLLKDNAVLIVETARNVVKLTEEQCRAYERKVLGMAAVAGLAFLARGRDIDGDTHAAGSVVSPDKHQPVSEATVQLGDSLPLRAFQYANSALDHPDVQGGDNPAAEHLVFANFAKVKDAVKKAWADSQPK